jgi:hypothetical protein
MKDMISGNVVVLRRTGRGLEDVVYDVSFAFAFMPFIRTHRSISNERLLNAGVGLAWFNTRT